MVGKSLEVEGWASEHGIVDIPGQEMDVYACGLCTGGYR